MDYIERNITEELSLENLADVANFSKYHFHRIFNSIVGETLNEFITRIRLEKAVAQLRSFADKSITEIALDSGYSSPSVFNKVFKKYYGCSPSEWKENSKICKDFSNNGKLKSNIKKENINKVSYDSVKRKSIWRFFMEKEKQFKTDVAVRDMEEFTVAYVRHIGPYKGNPELFENLFKEIFSWAGPRGLVNFPETKILSVYHDDPEITDESKLRTSICISVPDDTDVNGNIGKMKIPGGKYAFARFELKTDEYEAAWKHVFSEWLPKSGFQCADLPCFELYYNDCNEHPDKLSIVDICIPVKPL